MLLPLVGFVFAALLALGSSYVFCARAADLARRRGPAAVRRLWCLIVGLASAAGTVLAAPPDVSAEGWWPTIGKAFLFFALLGGAPSAIGGLVTVEAQRAGATRERAVWSGVIASLGSAAAGVLLVVLGFVLLTG
jgi:hypothetical protein